MPVAAARVVHLSIDRDWRAVYAFASDPENMPRWALGLAAGLKRDGDDWIGDGGPIGEIRVRFAPDNPFGVIDHTVTLADGVVVENALRVTPNHDGAEVSFTVIRQAAQDDAAFKADAAHVRRDLEALKRLLET
jgi:hypothetical protein